MDILFRPVVIRSRDGQFKPGYDLLVNLTKEFNVNLYYVLLGEGDMFMDATFSSFNRAKRYAVNVEDVHDFLYYFERSPLIQYFILSQFQAKMLLGKDIILRQMEEADQKLKR